MNSERGSEERTIGIDLATVTLVSLVARIAWHLVSPSRDWPDTAIYLETGHALLTTGRMSSGNYMPLYPILIEIIGYKQILTFQIILSALSAGLVYLVSLALFRMRIAALFAALVFALHPIVIFYANMRLSETVYVFLLLAACLAFYRGRFALGSVMFVAAILIRPILDLAAPFLIVAFCFARGEAQVKPIVRRLVLYALIYCVVMAPWWWHNWQLYHAFVRLSVSTGNLLIIENTPFFDRFGLDFDAIAPSWQNFPQADPIERDRAMTAAAVQYIKENPLHWLWRCVERLFRFWNPSPGSQSTLINVVALLATLPVMVMAVLGLSRMGKRHLIAVSPLLLIIVYMSAVHAVTHGIPRYRLPLEPFLMIFAGFWVAQVIAGKASKASP